MSLRRASRFTGILLALAAAGCWLTPVPPADAQWTSSASGSGTAQSAGLAPPTSLSASCGLVSASIKLDWTASTSAWTDGYKISRGTNSGTYTDFSTPTPVTNTTYTTPALPTSTYYFTVQATSGNWLSTMATQVQRSIVVLVIVPVCV